MAMPLGAVTGSGIFTSMASVYLLNVMLEAPGEPTDEHVPHPQP
jgi:hypothetical protein